MDRRDFLKSIGLAGISLTLPKPLSIVAAKISDLKDPPLHAGYVHFKFDREFAWHDLVMGYPSGLPKIDDYNRFINGSSTSCFFKIGQMPTKTPFLHVPTSHIPTPEVWADRHISGMSVLFQPGDELEIWCVPHRTPSGQMGKILKTDWMLRGTSPSPFRARSTMVYYPYQRMELVRVERARAIELGLAGPEEPEEKFLI